MSSHFLKAAWKNLIMANYIIGSEILNPYLPYKTVPDQYNGNVYLSLVGFLFSDTKLLGFSIPYHINFEEVNLRFYVRYLDNGHWKRGVVFIKEIVPRPAITFIANRIYRENYCTMPMKHSVKEMINEIEFSYHWRYKNHWNRLEASTEKKEVPMKEGSEEQFIAEHYWGYSKYNNNTTVEYEVQHVPWKVYPVKNYLVDCDFSGIYGNRFSFLKNAIPNSVFVAQGSEIAVLHKRIIK